MNRATKRAARRHRTGNANSPLLRPLSERRRAFVESFMGKAHGNATKAALAAGYSKATARKQGSRLLTFVDIQQAIAERAKNDPLVWAREDLQAWWTAVVSGASPHKRAALRDRLKASELLGKSQALFVDVMKGKLTLEQALGLSRDTGAADA